MGEETGSRRKGRAAALSMLYQQDVAGGGVYLWRWNLNRQIEGQAAQPLRQMAG